MDLLKLFTAIILIFIGLTLFLAIKLPLVSSYEHYNKNIVTDINATNTIEHYTNQFTACNDFCLLLGTDAEFVSLKNFLALACIGFGLIMLAGEFDISSITSRLFR